MPEFKLGDRVVVNAKTPFSALRGHCGVVVGFRGYDACGIEFDECIYTKLGFGHSCGGTAKPGHGWYLSPASLDPIPLGFVSIPDVTDLL